MHVFSDPKPGNPPTPYARAESQSPVEILDPTALPEWDSVLAGHPNATIFHTAAWASTLADTYGFRPQYLVQRQENQFAGLLALMRTGTRWTGHRYVSLPFTDTCPPLLPRERIAEGHSLPQPESPAGGSLRQVAPSEPLLSSALHLAESSASKSVELRDCGVWTKHLQPSVTFHGHIIPLLDSEEAQLQCCSSAMRRGLRKAECGPLRLKEGRELSDVEAYYSLHCRTRRRHGLPPQPFAFFRNIQRHVLQKGLGFVLLALDGDCPIAGAVFFGFGKHALYKFGASTETHLALRPNNLVLWNGIRRCAELGFSTLDLGRTSLDNEGLRRFKLGLGGEERMIQYVHQDVRSGCIVATPDRAQGLHNHIFRRLPGPVSRAVGALLYRFAA